MDDALRKTRKGYESNLEFKDIGEHEIAQGSKVMRDTIKSTRKKKSNAIQDPLPGM